MPTNQRAAAILEEAASLASKKPDLYDLVEIEARAACAVARGSVDALARSKDRLYGARLHHIAQEF